MQASARAAVPEALTPLRLKLLGELQRQALPGQCVQRALAAGGAQAGGRARCDGSSSGEGKAVLLLASAARHPPAAAPAHRQASKPSAAPPT